MDTKDKNCKNCRFFIRHYVNSKGKFTSLDLGHCFCERQKKYYLKIISVSHNCACFEEAEKEVKLTVENALIKTLERLNEYLQTLNSKEQ